MLESFASAAIAFSLLAIPSQSSTSSPSWESDYGRALANTRNNQKPLLVLLENPRDAAYRVEPVRSTNQQSAGEAGHLLSSYELCRVDASTEYGRQVAKAFKVQTLPYVAIIDKTGRKIIYRHAGQLTDTEWQTTLATHSDGEIVRAVPSSYSFFQQQQGFYNPSYCPSCQWGR